MSQTLVRQSYGKSHVRLSRIARTDSRHEFTELSVDVSLSGDFEIAYTQGDNRPVVPTDTMKNTVYALAKTEGVASCEAFSMALANHFVGKFAHIQAADVTVREQLWNRMQCDDHEHPHAFVGGGKEQHVAVAHVSGDGITLRSGLDGLQVLKTTDSGFAGFQRDEYTTLAETEDRIFATTITATWPCTKVAADWTAHRRTIRTAMLEVFANRYSPSVQKTLYDMAAAAFVVCAAIEEISITMPNQHHLLANLAALGLENENEIFVPTSEPFGMISATVRRDGKSM